MGKTKIKNGLIVIGDSSSSGGVILDIQGLSGQLFSVTDDLTGSIFSANDISGIPIMEVFADGTVNIGTFGAEAIIVTGSDTNIRNLEIQSPLRIINSFTPTGTADTTGNIGDVSWDDDYIYVKTNVGWKRSTLSTF